MTLRQIFEIENIKQIKLKEIELRNIRLTNDKYAVIKIPRKLIYILIEDVIMSKKSILSEYLLEEQTDSRF